MKALLFLAVIIFSNEYAGSIKSCKLDIVFCIDNSGSIGGFRTGGRFIKDWELVKAFAMDIIKEMRISPTRTRVGLVDFGDLAYPEFDLSEYTTKAEVLKAVAGLDYRGELTNTTGGLLESRIMLTDPYYGSRGEDVPKVIILITDGDPTVGEDTLDEEIVNLREAGILVVAVGVTNKINTKVLLKIATSRDDFYRVRAFSDLDKIKKFVVTDDLCEKRNISTLPPETTTSAPLTTETIPTETTTASTTTTVPTTPPTTRRTTTERSSLECLDDESSESIESLASSESSESSEDRENSKEDGVSRESWEKDESEDCDKEESRYAKKVADSSLDPSNFGSYDEDSEESYEWLSESNLESVERSNYDEERDELQNRRYSIDQMEEELYREESHDAGDDDDSKFFGEDY